MSMNAMPRLRDPVGMESIRNPNAENMIAPTKLIHLNRAAILD